MSFPIDAAPGDVLKLFEEKAKEFKAYRDGNRKLIDGLKPVVNIVQAVSGVLGQVVSTVPFQPAGAIFAGVDILLATASGVSSSYDALVELFECIGNFLKRLRIYTDLPLTPSMTDIIVKIMAELHSVLALATEQIKQGRFKKFAKKLLGESEIEAILQRLDRLTQEEGRMTMAQTFEVVHSLMNNVKVVMNDGKASMDGIWRALDTMQQMANDINKIRRDLLQKESRSWLSPPDPSPNYNTACEVRQDGTSMWFFQGSIFTEWNAKGSLLWIHGKAGSGKSILMSSIIQEIDRMCKAGLASMAYFYFDFRDTQKQHRRGLLSSLLSQLSAESDPCYHILSHLYSVHAGGTRQPSDDVLLQCLIEMLKVQGQPAVYIIIDALDECPNISGMPTAREKMLEFLEDLVGSELPNVHICVSSRTEFDIRASLEPLASFRVSLDDETGQKADILAYIKSVVHSDRRMRKWSVEDKQLVISALSDKADGMFRWVYCQLENLRRCFPSSIRGTLLGLPKTLDATYEHTLLGIDEEKWQFAHRLFQCLSVSVRPLRVEELAEILAVRFDAEVLPQFDTGWQLGHAEEAVLSACSSLITIVNVNGTRIVQFAHFSVKEFLTSDRLTTASENFSRYHIVPHLAHTTLAQASLGVLLQLDNCIDKGNITNFPLADYAARHWFDHCQLGNVSPTTQDAMKCLFDRGKPHFSAWIWMHDIDEPWRKPMPSKHPEPPEAAPLYYAILCGSHWLIEHLIVTYGDINAKGGYYGTPLLAAVNKILSQHSADVFVLENEVVDLLHRASLSEHVDIVRLLLDHNADLELPNEAGETPLYWASASGKLEIVRLLVERGANVHSRNKNGWTALKRASHHGHLDVVRLLIRSGADVDSPDNGRWTPLHSASRRGHINIVDLLIQHGADIYKQNNNQETPLDLASASGNLEITRLLVERDANVHSRNKNDWTALRRASHQGHLDVAQFLIDSGADVNSRSNKGWAPLHLASREGHLNVVQMLIEHGADVNQQNNNQDTPLDLASTGGNLEISRLLVERGANVHSRSIHGWTVLHRASHQGHQDIAQFLIDSGADVNTRNNRGWAPLHLASREGQVKIVELLIQRGADVNNKYDKQETPLHLASVSGNLEISRLLVQHNADVQSRDKHGVTPLQVASHHGHPDVVRFLIDSGADVNSRENRSWTPLHSAANNGHIEIVKLLLELGADFSTRNDRNRTPLDLALDNGKLQVADFLSGHMGGSTSQDGTVNTTPSAIGSQSRPPNVMRPTAKRGEKTPFGSEQHSLYSASRDGWLDVVRSMLDRGSDVNGRDTSRATPLDAASRNGQLEVVKLLVERGADVDSRDKDGWTPLITASKHGQLEVVRLLLDHGADVNAQTRGYFTALRHAAHDGYFKIVQLLLERGANVDIRDANGQTPKQVAEQLGHRKIVELLSGSL